MKLEELVDAYIDAWNRQDLDDIFRLIHPGAAFYDAFWMESCVGPDLVQYFQNAMVDEPFWFERIGDVIETESGVSFRYCARDRSGPRNGEPIRFGAEVFVLRANKILTITEFYCSFDPADLEEVAELVTKRHGLPTYTKFGMSGLKSMRVKAELSAKMDDDKVYLDPDITISKLADRMGCSLEQLSIVINQHMGTSFRELLDNHRIEYAKALLQDEPDNPNIVSLAAAQAGFKSSGVFSDKFTSTFGIAPKEFCRHISQKDSAGGNLTLH